MSEVPPMFLVRVETGKRARVYKVDPFEAMDPGRDGDPGTMRRRQPKAWQIRPAYPPGGRPIGFAAIGSSVDDAYRLIDRLRNALLAEVELA